MYAEYQIGDTSDFVATGGRKRRAPDRLRRSDIVYGWQFLFRISYWCHVN